MPQLTITAQEMVARARARINEVETSWLIAHHDQDDIIIIDIRDIRERQKTGFIPGSHHAPRGMLEFWVDSDSPYYRDLFGHDDKHYILHCASGWRSALAAATLQDMGFTASHLKAGFTDWQAENGPIDHISPKPPEAKP